MIDLSARFYTNRRGSLSRVGRVTVAVFVIVVALVGCTSDQNVNPTGSVTAEPSTSASPTDVPGTVVPFRSVTPGSAVDKRFGLIAPTGSDPFSREVTESIVAQMTVAGAELIQCDPGVDGAMSADCARRMAVQEVDGWIVQQPGDMGPSVCEAGPQEVPLITIGGTSLECQTARVGADDEQAGYLVGAELGRLASARSGCATDILIVVADGAASGSGERRVAGVLSGAEASCPGLTDRRVTLEAGTQDQAYDQFPPALTALAPDSQILVAAVNDGVALGVAASVPADRADTISLASIGADQRARCEIAGGPTWIGDSALFPDRYGEVVVPALLDALDKTTVPPVVHIETTFLTADTLGGYYALDDCPTT